MTQRLFASGMCAIALAACSTPTPIEPDYPPQLSREEYRAERDRLTEIVHTLGPGAALASLSQQAASEAVYAGSCHALAHEIGRAAFKREGSFGAAMQYADEICNSGYMHGIIELSFALSPDIPETMSTICRDFPDGTFGAWECYHGIGHGLMFASENDLPASVEQCETYEEEFRRKSCVNGVYMENFNTDGTLHPSQYTDAQSPLAPCEKQPIAYKGVCYLYAPTHALALRPKTYVETLDLCDDVDPPPYRPSCYAGVGMQTMKENILDTSVALEVCAHRDGNDELACLSGAVGLLINHHGSLRPARSFCATLDERRMLTCLDTVNGHASLFAAP